MRASTLVRWYCDKWRYIWSAWRHRKSLIFYPCELTIETLIDIPCIAKQMYDRNYAYEIDGPDKMFDSLDTPAQCWHDLWCGILRDDCDGFAAAMYWLLSQNHIDCRLLNIITPRIKDSHTVVVFRWMDEMLCLDYDVLTGPFCTLSEVLASINEHTYNFKYKEFLYVNFSRWTGERWETDNAWVNLNTARES